MGQFSSQVKVTQLHFPCQTLCYKLLINVSVAPNNTSIESEPDTDSQ